MPIRPYMRICNDKKLESAWHGTTFGEAFAEWSEAYGNLTCVVDGNRRTTYYEAWMRAKRLSAYFLKLGISKGDIALFRLGNTDNFIYTLFALYELGVIPVMLRAANRKEEIAQIARLTKPTLFITLDTYLGKNSSGMVKEITEECSSIKAVIYERDIASIYLDPANKLEDMHYEKPKVTDVSHLMLSGGTTGIPKLAPRTHYSYLFSSICMADRSLDGPDDNCLVVLPASHNYTLLSDIFPTLASGGTLIMCENPSPAEILHLVQKEGVTHLSLVPTLARLCIAYRSAYDNDDISTLRFISEGGSKVSEDLARETMDTFGCPLQHCYGMVEGYLCASYLDDSESQITENLTTTVILADELMIIDPDGHELPPGKLGEFVFKGPTRFEGYFGQSSKGKDTFTKEGFYRTGDLGFLDEYGRLGIRGRVKEQINRAGESIMPEVVETALRRHPLIKDCVAIGLPDEELGERICAFVVSAGPIGSLHDVVERLREEGISEHHIPDDLIGIDQFPETPAKKVDKKKLIELANTHLRQEIGQI